MSATNKPEWLKSRVNMAAMSEMEALLRSYLLHTVCEDADCPNRGECFKSQTATFMILGNVCTRACRFCTVSKGEPLPLNPNEPANLAAVAKKLGLLHTVVTSVTRDDLADGGAAQFARTIAELKKHLPDSSVEVLIPDFEGNFDALHTVISARPDIINHNIETVPSLYSYVRPKASYQRSLELLKRVKESGNDIYSKTGLMLGLGEKFGEVCGVLDDLVGIGCDMLTIGQYLAPSRAHIPVAEYIHPDQFEEYRLIAMKKGIKYVASAPLVRSSYKAAEGLQVLKNVYGVS